MSDMVSFIEACYAVEQTPVAWLRELARRANALLGMGLGAHAWFVDLEADDVSTPILATPLLVDGRPEWEERWRDAWWNRVMLAMPAEYKRLMHSHAPVSSFADIWSASVAQSPSYAAYMRARVEAEQETPRAGGVYPDSFNIVALDATRRGVVLAIAMADAAKATLDPAVFETWSLLIAHIAAGHRLVSTLHASEPEVILSPDGRVEHAVAEVRDLVAIDALRERVAAVDRLRTHERGDADLATEVWQGLTEGRWSLVDHFESDGRRFYLARENRPAVRLVELGEREEQIARAAALGHSNKLIAYELGVSVSTVTAHLKSAAQKLGAGSRLDLIRAVRKREG